MMFPPSMARVYGEPNLSGKIRLQNEDFVVIEQLGFKPSGSGEHVLVEIEKKGANSAWVADQLATFAGVARRSVSFAGRKDRHALTRQTFSVWLPGKTAPDWSALKVEGVRVLAAGRHHRKLKTGALAGNRFCLCVRHLHGNLSALNARLEMIRDAGVPNYFGAQRFGREGQNLASAERMFAGQKVARNKRNMYISAARSAIFNAVLSCRVADHSWNQARTGDLWNLAGSRAFFGPEKINAEIVERLAQLAIHPTGPLWGRGDTLAAEDLRILEMKVANHYVSLKDGLVNVGLKAGRRALRVVPENMRWCIDAPNHVLKLEFALPAGSYATALLHEILDVDSADDGKHVANALK